MNSKDYSTSNYINHLNTAHGITKEKHNQKIKKQQVTQQPQIDTIFRKIILDNLQRKNLLDQKFVSLLIKDHQPLSIREDEGFLEFIYELDPLYQLPNE